MRHRILLCAVTISLFSFSSEAKRAGNRPYVQSSDGGYFYARCIPDEADGDKGTTAIFRVRKDGDELMNQYDWYNGGGLYLGWSPSAGEVAVVRLRQEHHKQVDEQIELSFYLGGKFLRSHTTSDLVKLGADAQLIKDSGHRAQYKPIGFAQVPRTNDFYFEIALENGTTLKFNAINGNLCRVDEKKRIETESTHTSIYTDYKLIDLE